MNTNIKINICKINEGAKIPEYKSSGASGLDLCSCESCVIAPGKIKLISTGLKLEIPEGYEAQIRSRSGLALNFGVFCLNSPGTIDSDYRGEIKIILCNLGEKDFEINAGDRVAQIIFSRVERAELNLISEDELSKTGRSLNGFGSTGI